MLDTNMFVVTPKSKLFSSRHSYEIRDQTGQVLGAAEQKTGLLASLLGMIMGPPSTSIDFRTSPNSPPTFSVRRRGFLFKKVETVNGKGEVVGLYKAKSFSLSGGYHVYDAAGKHVAEVRGKLFKAEFTFFAPDGKTEMGKVSRQWGGMMKEMFSSDHTYGVQISPEFADDQKTKMMILGGAVAIDALLRKHGGKGGKDEEGEAESGGEE